MSDDSCETRNILLSLWTDGLTAERLKTIPELLNQGPAGRNVILTQLRLGLDQATGLIERHKWSRAEMVQVGTPQATHYVEAARQSIHGVAIHKNPDGTIGFYSDGECFLLDIKGYFHRANEVDSPKWEPIDNKGFMMLQVWRDRARLLHS